MLESPTGTEKISKHRGLSKEDFINRPDSIAPLRGGLGTAWDKAYATLFPAFDDEKFITAVPLSVDALGLA